MTTSIFRFIVIDSFALNNVEKCSRKISPSRSERKVYGRWTDQILTGQRASGTMLFDGVLPFIALPSRVATANIAR